MRVAITAIASLVLTSACAGFPENPALERVDRGRGYRFEALVPGAGNTDDTFVIVTLSGGGTRAAALAYGVLARLSETRLSGGRTLLDEVDVISSVSGGSFAAAYYGLFGRKRFFTRFPDEVLRLHIESALLWRVLAPWNCRRCSPPATGAATSPPPTTIATCSPDAPSPRCGASARSSC